MKAAIDWFKNLPPWGKAVLIGLLVTIIFLVVKGILKKQKEQKELEERKNNITKPIVIDNAGTTFNAGPYTDALYTDITGDWFSARNLDPYKNLMTLDDTRIRAVWEDWNTRYYLTGKVKNPLGKAISGETGTWFNEFSSLRDSIVQRFTRMGLQ